MNSNCKTCGLYGNGFWHHCFNEKVVPVEEGVVLNPIYKKKFNTEQEKIFMHEGMVVINPMFKKDKNRIQIINDLENIISSEEMIIVNPKLEDGKTVYTVTMRNLWTRSLVSVI